MKYCRQCGEAIDDAAVVCTRCGIQQTEQNVAADNQPLNEQPGYQYASHSDEPADSAAAAPAAKPKKKRTALIIALSAALLLVAVAVTLFATGAYAALLPHSRLKLGLAEKKLVEQTLDEAFAANTSNDSISADLSVTLDAEFDPSSQQAKLWEILNALNIDLSIDTTGSDLLLGAGIGYMGNPLMNATVVANDSELGLYIPALDSNYYTLSLASLKDMLEAEMGTELDSSVIAALTSFFSDVDETAMRKDIMEMLEILSGISTASNTKITRNHELELFDGKDVQKVALYVITPNEEAISNVLNALVDYWNSGDSYIFNKLIDLAEALPLELGSTDDMFDELRDELPDIAKAISDAGLTIEIAMKGNEIVSQRFSFELYEVEYTVGYDELTVNDETRAAAYVNASEYGSYIINHTQKQNGSMYSGKIEMTSRSTYPGTATESVDYKLEYEYDSSRTSILGLYEGEYRISLTDMVELEITVAPKDGGMNHTIVIAPSSSFYEDSIDLDFSSLSINVFAKEGASVTKPSVTPTDVSNYTDEQFEGILDGWQMQLYTVLFGIIGM